MQNNRYATNTTVNNSATSKSGLNEGKQWRVPWIGPSRVVSGRGLIKWTGQVGGAGLTTCGQAVLLKFFLLAVLFSSFG